MPGLFGKLILETTHLLILPATIWKSDLVSCTNTCDCGELQTWLNIGHLDNHTGDELRFIPVLLVVILFFVTLWDCRWRQIWFLRRFFLFLRTLVTTVALVVWWFSDSSLSPVTTSENTEIKTSPDRREDSDKLAVWSVVVICVTVTTPWMALYNNCREKADERRGEEKVWGLKTQQCKALTVMRFSAIGWNDQTQWVVVPYIS